MAAPFSSLKWPVLALCVTAPLSHLPQSGLTSPSNATKTFECNHKKCTNHCTAVSLLKCVSWSTSPTLEDFTSKTFQTKMETLIRLKGCSKSYAYILETISNLPVFLSQLLVGALSRLRWYLVWHSPGEKISFCLFVLTCRRQKLWL